MEVDNIYQKQTYRNRTEIYGANGKLKLTIPIVHAKNQGRQIDENVAIHYENGWQKEHNTHTDLHQEPTHKHRRRKGKRNRNDVQWFKNICEVASNLLFSL